MENGFGRWYVITYGGKCMGPFLTHWDAAGAGNRAWGLGNWTTEWRPNG